MAQASGEADQLRNSDLLKAWWARQEADAIALMISAKPEDDERRRWYAQRLQIIRDMRRDLTLFAEGTANAPHMADR